jgi:hypothetical protein
VVINIMVIILIKLLVELASAVFNFQTFCGSKLRQKNNLIKLATKKGCKVDQTILNSGNNCIFHLPWPATTPIEQ